MAKEEHVGIYDNVNKYYDHIYIDLAELRLLGSFTYKHINRAIEKYVDNMSLRDMSDMYEIDNNCSAAYNEDYVFTKIREKYFNHFN